MLINEHTESLSQTYKGKKKSEILYFAAGRKDGLKITKIKNVILSIKLCGDKINTFKIIKALNYGSIMLHNRVKTRDTTGGVSSPFSHY